MTLSNIYESYYEHYKIICGICITYKCIFIKCTAIATHMENEDIADMYKYVMIKEKL